MATSTGSFNGSKPYSPPCWPTRAVGAADVGTNVDFTFAGTPAELTSLINAWRTNNADLAVSATSTTGLIVMRFDSRETAFAPQLLVDLVPEPGAIVLLASGLIGLLAYAWRKRN